MNIFILDENPIIAATMMFDKHIVKMPLETAQMLSTINGGPYKATHINHPCILWASSSITNYNWLVTHGLALCKEYTFRYNKEHKCEDIINALANPLVELNNTIKDTFVKCMPDIYKQIENPVEAYREYYKSKRPFAAWTKREQPNWFSKTQSL